MCEGAGVTRVAPLSYLFYRDSYGGTLDAESFAEALPAARRCVRALCGGAEPTEKWHEADADAWKRACCAAVEAFAKFGEGRIGGYEIGEFKVTNYRDDRTTGREVAMQAALDELAGTGLAWCGVR